MGSDIPTFIDFDWASYDPWRVQSVRHRLCEHPLLQIDQLIELGRRLEPSGQYLTYSNTATAADDFHTVSLNNPNRKSVVDTLQDISRANAWMLLRHVQQDPAYRGLVDEILDSIKPQIERKDPGMCYRAGWIFVTSPRAITPFHVDKNHVLILQLHGPKTLYVWDPDDTAVVSHRARDRFHASYKLDLLKWQEEYRARAHVFHLEPGMGVYMPLTSPHMAEVSDQPSIAISLSYNTDATRRNTLLHSARDRMHRAGIESPPVGQNAFFDSFSYAGALALRNVRRLGRRLAGRPLLSDGAPYAVAE